MFRATAPPTAASVYLFYGLFGHLDPIASTIEILKIIAIRSVVEMECGLRFNMLCDDGNLISNRSSSSEKVMERIIVATTTLEIADCFPVMQALRQHLDRQSFIDRVQRQQQDYYARSQNCQQLTIDSGVQRFAAHRFYLMQRMNITSHHSTLEL
jgi:hypothetical protein